MELKDNSDLNPHQKNMLRKWLRCFVKEVKAGITGRMGHFGLNLGDSYAGRGKASNNSEYQKRHIQFGKIEIKRKNGLSYTI